MVIKAYIGCIGSGKDFMAKKETDIQLAFADALREEVWKMLGWKPKTPEEYEEFKTQKWKLPGNRLCYFSGRDILQKYGTDIRRKEDKDHWAKKLIERILYLRKYDMPIHVGDKRLSRATIGITDCRFENEVRKLIEFSLEETIKVEFIHTDFKSERYDPKAQHESEKFAQQFVGFNGSQEEFNKLIWSKYEN